MHAPVRCATAGRRRCSQLRWLRPRRLPRLRVVVVRFAIVGGGFFPTHTRNSSSVVQRVPSFLFLDELKWDRRIGRNSVFFSHNSEYNNKQIEASTKSQGRNGACASPSDTNVLALDQL